MDDGVRAASADGVAIAYEAHGAGTSALVFVHGWSCDRTYWKGQLQPLGRRYRVVAIDLAGHGESGTNRQAWTIAAFGADVAAVVEKLGLERVILVGHSMGGDVIVEAARRMPGRVAGLVWVDVYRKLDAPPTAERIEAFVAPFRADFAERTRAFVRSMFPATADKSLVGWIAADMSSAPKEIALAAMVSAREPRAAYWPSERRRKTKGCRARCARRACRCAALPGEARGTQPRLRPRRCGDNDGMIHRGSCHCGAVAFEVEAPEKPVCQRCNCSVCTKSGFLHLIVPRSRFRLLRGEENLSTYTFNTGVAKHLFCRTCGMKPFYVPRSNPDGVDVNVNCLDPVPTDIVVEPFDGQNWEANAAALAHLSKE